MKRTFPILLLLIFLLPLKVLAQNWTLDFNKALEEAKSSNKAVLLNFSGSDWCGPCIRMKKEVFANEVFTSLAKERLILVNADFPRLKKNKLSKEQLKHNEALAEKYNQKGNFPLTLLFDSEGKLLKSWIGFPGLSAEKFTAQVNQALPQRSTDAKNLRKFSKQKLLMGSAFSITVVGEDWKTAEGLIDSAYAHIQAIERLISSWDPASQTSEINRNAGRKPVKVDQELFGLIERSKKISALTQGAFDISFGSLDKGLWHFDGRVSKWPDKNAISRSIRLINYENIILDHEASTVFLKDSGMRIGFGAIGKGYAARSASDFLKKAGVESGVVNAGGDLYCWGKKPNSQAWTISIADPENKNEAISQIQLSNMSAVTSGNYEKYILVDGVKYCHIIDPRTGYPVINLSSVTVITLDPELADALATSVFILGKEVGLDLINQMQGVECVIIDENNEMHTSTNIQLAKND